MIPNCEQLSQHLRRNLGSVGPLALLKVHEAHGFVSFRWHERDFVVKRSMESFEVKGQNLLVTGASILMQAVLRRAESNSVTIEGLVNSIQATESLIKDEKERGAGFKLLANMKATLRRLASHRTDEVSIGVNDANTHRSDHAPQNTRQQAEHATEL